MPGVLYVIVGFCATDDNGVPPANVHDHDVGVLVERSVKFTVPPEHSVVGDALKSATGGAGQLFTVM